MDQIESIFHRRRRRRMRKRKKLQKTFFGHLILFFEPNYFASSPKNSHRTWYIKPKEKRDSPSLLV
jgi:hypothetical protein